MNNRIRFFSNSDARGLGCWLYRLGVLACALASWIAAYAFIEGYCTSGLVIVLQGYWIGVLANLGLLFVIAWCLAGAWADLQGVDTYFRRTARSLLLFLGGILAILLLAQAVVVGPPPLLSHEQCQEGWQGWGHLF